MRSLTYFALAAALFAAPGPALAKQTPTKQISTVTANDPNLHHDLHHVVGHISSLADQPPPASEPTYLNLQTHNAPHHASNVSLEGGEPTPYGFPGASEPDDQIGFYKDPYVAYENSPLDGYYSWSGHISP
jgi:hypothetical protein